MSDNYLVGIDFGACNIKAVAIENGVIEPVQLSSDQEKKYAPNLIFYNKKQNGDIDKLIGAAAEVRRIRDRYGENYVDNIKRRLEIADWSKPIVNLGREVTAKEAAKDVFAALKNFLNESETPRCAITVPVCYTIKQREAIREAAKNAGLIVDAVISEPLAALFSLSDIEQKQADELILIFDFGGSTLDVSVSELIIEDDEFLVKELASVGIKFGGLDIDRDIYEEIFLPKYKGIFDEVIDKNIVNREDIFLRFTAAMKEKLIKSGEDSIDWMDLDYNPFDKDFDDFDEAIELSLDDLDELFEKKKYGEKITDLLDALFRDLRNNGKDKEDLTKVRVFGGTCQIPFFTKLLQEYFGKDLIQKNDFNNEAALLTGVGNRYLGVAAGAAKFLAISDEKKEDFSIECHIPFCIGYEAGGRFHRGIDSSMPFGFEVTNITLSVEELRNNGFKLKLYQRFNNAENNSVEELGEAVHLADVELDPSKYEKDKDLRMEMRMMKNRDNDKVPDGYGCLRLCFVALRKKEGEKKSEHVVLQEFLIPIGGK